MIVPFYKHPLSSDEKNAIIRVIDSPFLTTGPEVARFQTDFAAYYNDGRDCVATNSWTSAAYLCLKYWNVGIDDEVIIPAITFVSCANIVTHTGAKLVLADCDQATGLVKIDSIISKITDRTKVIMIVHLFGSIVELGPLKLICDAKGIKILEDCAHSVESKYGSILPGTQGDAACYSFYATKNLACGEGGALTSKDLSLIEFALQNRLHGMNKSAINRYTSGYEHYDVSYPGYKSNLPDLLAALLNVQLPKLDARRDIRETLCSYYEERLTQGGVDFVPQKSQSARHLFAILAPEGKRDVWIEKLKQSGVGVAVHFRAIYQLSLYKDLGNEFELQGSESYANRTISIPLYLSLDRAEQDYILESILQLRNL
jgi:UDP-4-amino-4-deoxy-L-arabinose-oxoglutarate aminotransferase